MLLVVVIFPRRRLTAQVSDYIHAAPLRQFRIAALISVVALDYDLLHLRSTDLIGLGCQHFHCTLLSQLLRVGIQGLLHIQL